eukprot:6150771-Pyramimonas_sp.AAC.1
MTRDMRATYFKPTAENKAMPSCRLHSVSRSAPPYDVFEPACPPSAEVVAYLDDIYIISHPRDTAAIYDNVKAVLTE